MDTEDTFPLHTFPYTHLSQTTISAEIHRRTRLRNHPRLIQRAHNLLGQRPLFQIRQITLQLPKATHPNNNTIVSALCTRLQLGMMHTPA
jgi:hypothetical protein